MNFSNTKSSKRRQSRELILQALFQQDYIKCQSLLESLNRLKSIFAIEPEVYEFSEKIAKHYDHKASQIDETIQSLSRNWTLARMGGVDKNILRFAIVEIKYLSNEVPISVIINEAVEIAKKFGSEDSASFINGILDQAAKDSPQYE